MNRSARLTLPINGHPSPQTQAPLMAPLQLLPPPSRPGGHPPTQPQPPQQRSTLSKQLSTTNPSQDESDVQPMRSTLVARSSYSGKLICTASLPSSSRQACATVVTFCLHPEIHSAWFGLSICNRVKKSRQRSTLDPSSFASWS